MEQKNKENEKVILYKDEQNDEIQITFDTTCFGAYDIESYKAKKEKRFNLKVKDSDILLLDITSKELGISRNALINVILDTILVKWLDEVEDIDTKVLIALSAEADDADGYYDYWLKIVFADLVHTATINCVRYGSDQLINNAGYLKASGELDEPEKNLMKAMAKKNEPEINKWKSCIKKIYGRSDSFDAVRKLIGNERVESFLENILSSNSFESECTLIENAVNRVMEKNDK